MIDTNYSAYQVYSQKQTARKVPAFTSKLLIQPDAYEAIFKTFNDSGGYRVSFFNGLSKFVKGVKSVYKDYGMDGVRAYKNQCFGVAPNAKAMVAITTKRFEDITKDLPGETVLFGVKRGDSNQLGVNFKYNGKTFNNSVGTDMAHSLVPLFPKTDLVDYCVGNLLEKTARAINPAKGNDFDTVKWLLEHRKKV